MLAGSATGTDCWASRFPASQCVRAESLSLCARAQDTGFCNQKKDKRRPCDLPAATTDARCMRRQRARWLNLMRTERETRLRELIIGELFKMLENLENEFRFSMDFRHFPLDFFWKEVKPDQTLHNSRWRRSLNHVGASLFFSALNLLCKLQQVRPHSFVARIQKKN